MMFYSLHKHDESHLTFVLVAADADPEDTGQYGLEIENDSGAATCNFGLKVKGAEIV